MVTAVQSVLLTTVFQRHAENCGLKEDDIQEIVSIVAANPLAGDMVAGTGGARKLRHPFGSKGKSGGIRTIHYFGGADVPIFMLAVFGKHEKENLTKSERNELAKLLPRIAENYRKGKTR